MRVTTREQAQALPIGTTVRITGHPSRRFIGLQGVITQHYQGVDLGVVIRPMDGNAASYRYFTLHQVNSFEVLSTPQQETTMPIIRTKAEAQALPLGTKVIIRDHPDSLYVGQHGTIFARREGAPLGIRIRNEDGMGIHLATAIEVVASAAMVKMADIEAAAQLARAEQGNHRAIDAIVNILKFDHVVWPVAGGWHPVVRKSTGEEVARFRDRQAARAFRASLPQRDEVPFDEVEKFVQERAEIAGWCGAWRTYVERLRPKPAVHPNVAKYPIAPLVRTPEEAVAPFGTTVTVVSSIDPTTGALRVNVNRLTGEPLPISFAVNGITSAVVEPVSPSGVGG